jgi:putative ABC transport system substrate-binding protein
MHRRAFGQGALASLLLVAAGAVRPQPAGKIFRIGFLANHIPLAELESGKSASFTSAVAFVEGMRALGWEEGRNIHIVWKSAESEMSRHPRLAEELVRMPVDLIVSFSEGVDAATRATRTIPIVMGGHYQPVESGYAKSLARPGGNVTGVVQSAGAEFQKTMALLKEASPGVSRVAFIVHVRGEMADRLPPPRADSFLGRTAKALGFEIFFVPFGDPGSIDSVVRSAAWQGAQALLIEPNYALYGNREASRRLYEEAIRQRLPVMHTVLGAVVDGGLMAHGTDETLLWRRVPYYVNRILKGDRPGDIPIEQPSKVEFHINLKAARAIGLEVPPSLLLQADRVIP